MTPNINKDNQFKTSENEEQGFKHIPKIHHVNISQKLEDH